MQKERSKLPRCEIVIHEDHNESPNLPTSMTCPLCKSSLRLYQLHYDEKLLLCSNGDCEFPFGYADYHIYKVETNVDFVRANSSSVGCSSVTSGSTMSNSDWSEINKLMNVLNNPMSPMSPMDSPLPSLIEKPQNMKKIAEMMKQSEDEEEMRKNVKRIKQLNKQLFENNDVDCISNEKWIRHIAIMQERSGVQLLKEHELKKVKKAASNLSTGELRIDIDSSTHAISLKIEPTKLSKGNNDSS